MAFTTPPTATGSTVPDAAFFNTYVRDNFKALGDAWTSYTPTLTGWTLVNGTLNGWFSQQNKSIRGRIEYTVGSSDTKSAAPTFSLPVAAVEAAGTCMGEAGLFDTSASARAFRFVLFSTAGGGTLAMSTEADVRISPTAPWTWATGDQMLLRFHYEAA